MKKTIFLLLAVVIIVIGWYFYRFYPQQQMPTGKPIFVETPEPEKYHNDCLHPCIRTVGDSSFVMVQSPYYAWNNKIENPMFYRSNSLTEFGMGELLDDSPKSGFNSDPNVFVEDTSVYVFWRAFGTPLCQELGVDEIVLGKRVDNIDSLQIIDNHIYIYIINGTKVI